MRPRAVFEVAGVNAAFFGYENTDSSLLPDTATNGEISPILELELQEKDKLSKNIFMLEEKKIFRFDAQEAKINQLTKRAFAKVVGILVSIFF